MRKIQYLAKLILIILVVSVVNSGCRTEVDSTEVTQTNIYDLRFEQHIVSESETIMLMVNNRVVPIIDTKEVLKIKIIISAENDIYVLGVAEQRNMKFIRVGEHELERSILQIKENKLGNGSKNAQAMIYLTPEDYSKYTNEYFKLTGKKLENF